MGAVSAPLTVPWIAIHYGWLACWLGTYHRPEEQPRLSRAELEYIRGDPAEPSARIPWPRLFPQRQTWAFAAGKFLTDPIWWFYLFWLPKFLNETQGVSSAKIGVNRARKTALFICACAVTPVFFASMTSHLWVIVALVGAAAAGHQGWWANLFATVGDMFPRQAVGSVAGLGGMMGAIGGMLLALVVIQVAAPKLDPVRW